MKVKYPRTYHVPWSDGVSSDDKIIKDLSHFEGREIVMTEKMDGENTTLMNLWYYARSLDSAHHPSQNWVKSLWGNIKHDIPEDWRICGENLYAQHSIKYDKNITKPPYKTIHIDTVTVEEPDIDNLGEIFYDILWYACYDKGYTFKFYTSSSNDNFDYELVVK